MNKNQIGQVMKGFSVLILIGCILFLLLGGFALYTTVNLQAGKSVSFRMSEGLNRKAGTLAEIAGIGSALFWLIRKAMKLSNNRGSILKEWLRQFYMLLRNHHIFLGITTLVIAFIHGLYFLLFRNVSANMGPRHHDNTLNFYSGIAAFFALAVLAALGWNHQSKRKTKQNMKTKKQHMVTAFVFGILAVIHIYLI